MIYNSIMSIFSAFGKSAEEDSAAVLEWVNKIKGRSQKDTLEKSQRYGFDFDQDRHYLDSKFDWDIDNKQMIVHTQRSSFLTGLSTITSLSEELDNPIPDIEESRWVLRACNNNRDIINL